MYAGVQGRHERKDEDAMMAKSRTIKAIGCVVVSLGLGVLVTGCGSVLSDVDSLASLAGDGVPSANGGSSSSNTTVAQSQQSLTCCINGSKYMCPSQDAFQRCATESPDQCSPAGGC
jgi:hypothetical protein